MFLWELGVVLRVLVCIQGSPTRPLKGVTPTLNPNKFVETIWNPFYPFNHEVPPLVGYIHTLGQLKNITFGNPYEDLATVQRGGTAHWPVQYCGVHFMNKGEGYILSHRAFDDQPTNDRCVWGFVGDRSCTPRVECPDFKGVPGASCRSNYLQISDGGASFIHHFCDHERSPQTSGGYTAKDGVLDVVLRYSSPDQRPNFTCWVSCVNYQVNYTVTGSNAVGSLQPLRVTVHEQLIKFLQDTLPAPKRNPQCSCGMPNNAAQPPTASSPVVGQNRTERVVGGRVTLPNQYPWTLGLLSKNGKLPYCGAALISAEYVLTAQHCIQDEDLEDIIVVLNEHDYFNDNETVGRSLRRGVVEVVNYPYYMESTFSGDIALLRLNRPVFITQRQFNPVCLPNEDELWVGREVLATGWGTTSGGPMAMKSPLLLEVPLVVFPNEACNDYHPHDPPEPPQVMNNMLCAGYTEGGRDTCAGDSGGPLTGRMTHAGGRGRYAQIGVTSWGFGCAVRYNPGVFSRVSAFMYWIRMHTVDAHFCLE